jgi:hypothetical protein
MSTRLLAVIAAVALMAVSCGLLDSGSPDRLDPLIRAADGSLYAPQCLAAVGVDRKRECEVHAPGAGVRSTQGHSTTASPLLAPYYDFFQTHGYFSYVDPYFYAPDTFCGRWGWSSSCFDWFGYGGWQFPGGRGYCDDCFYIQGSSTSGSCPRYCSSWWYPWPWQPTTDACSGLAGTYSGVCWSSGATTFGTAISLSVAASNGTCQVTASGYGSARVTVRHGVGSAALIGTTAGSAAFVDFYGSGSFTAAGYDPASYSWFRCTPTYSYQPWLQ